jgi:hypothetical protein
MHFLFSFLKIKGLYMFRAYPQEALHKLNLQPCHSQLTYARNVPNSACAPSCNHSTSAKPICVNPSWGCVCSLTYPVCNVHVPYCHPWPVRLNNIFPHYLINATIFQKKVTEYKMCFDFLHKFVEMFLILRRSERDMIQNV